MSPALARIASRLVGPPAIRTERGTMNASPARPARRPPVVRLAAAAALAVAAGLAATGAPAQQGSATTAQDPHRTEDIAKHRTIAAAHEAAAKCLESGAKESSCHEALRKACEGLAVGRYCGMKHTH